MKRSYPPEYDRNNEPSIIPKATIDLFLKNENEPFFALYALYGFYYYTAKWQKTNSAYATVNYAAAATGLGRDRIRSTKKELINLGLISEIQRKNEKGQIAGYFIKINFIFGERKTQELSHPPKNTDDGKKTTLLKNQRVENPEGNSLSSDNLNSLSSSNSSPITEKLFEKFWEIYPRKISKGDALRAWKKLCRSSNPNRPDWKIVRLAIRNHSRTKQWQSSPKNIPHPATWLNNFRWLNSAEDIDLKWQQVQEINRKQSGEPKEIIGRPPTKMPGRHTNGIITWNGDMKEYNVNDTDTHPPDMKEYYRRMWPDEYKG